MKRLTLIAALSLGLVACGPNQAVVEPPVGPIVQPPVEPPSEGYPYNPAPSATESSDTRVPYLGDWAWVVRLPDGDYRRGVLSVTYRGEPTEMAKNGGVGSSYLCQDDTCATRYQASYGVINSFVVNGEVELGAVIGDPTSTTRPPTNRLGILDADARVELNAGGHPVIAGEGEWVEVTGQPSQRVRAAFVQMDTTPGDDLFGVPRTEAFAQARAAAEAVVVTPQRVNAPSLLGLPQMAPAR